MENIEIARALREVADLLEIRGDNPFKVRAYRNAARTVESTARPLAEMVRGGADLEQLPTIGRDMAAYITELVQTGRLGRLETLERGTPRGVAELMQLEGVGPKKALQLHRELDIRSLADLEHALERHEVERLRGFGPRSADQLRQAVRDRRRHLQRYKLADADQLARPLLEHLRRAPGLRELGVAGSYRRRVETVGDLDLLAAADAPGRVVEHFTRYPDAVRVVSAGTTRGAIVLPTGLRVDLRVVRPRSWGAALHYFTGSKAHNIAVRRLGVERGLRINEYGVYRQPRVGRSARIGGAREEDVFRAVDMDWVAPELREARGEIEAARNGTLPDLVTLDDIRGDLQMHSRWSDGRTPIEALARAAQRRGYDYIAITDHGPAVAIAHGLQPADLEKQWREIDTVNRRVQGITVLKGIEVDILPDGSLDLPDELLARLDIVVAAVHSSMGMARDTMTQRIVHGISNPHVHILAHPTGRILNRREPYAVDIDTVLSTAAQLGVAVEINAHPDRLDLSDIHAFRARELGAHVAINTDAHDLDHLDYMRYGVDQARRAWLGKDQVLNTLSLAALRNRLARRSG